MEIQTDQVFSLIKENREKQPSYNELKELNADLFAIQSYLNSFHSISAIFTIPTILTQYEMENTIIENHSFNGVYTNILQSGWIQEKVSSCNDSSGCFIIEYRNCTVNIICKGEQMKELLQSLFSNFTVYEIYNGIFEISCSLGSSSFRIPIPSHFVSSMNPSYLSYVEERINKSISNFYNSLPDFFSKVQFQLESFKSNSLSSPEWYCIGSPSDQQNILYRCQHASCLIPQSNQLAIFGGYGYCQDASSPHRLNDLILLNTETGAIDSYYSSGLHMPSPRLGSSLCCLQEGLFLFGGRQNPSSPLNDCWFFDFSSLQWIQLTDLPTCPSPRWSCSMVPVNAHMAVLFGGRSTTDVYGDCWSVFLKKHSTGEIECKWSLLYDSQNSIYNGNPSPGPCFQSIILPVVQNDLCDEILVFSGMRNLLGERCEQQNAYQFKLSKRQWFTIQVKDETNLFSQLIHCRATVLCPNYYLILGIHASTCKPHCLLAILHNHSLQIIPYQSFFSSFQSYLHSIPSSSSSSGETLTEPFSTVFSGYSLHYASNKLYLIGGGGIFYWMPHFNQSIWCDFPLTYIVSGEELMKGEKERRKRIREKIEEESSQVKLVKQEEEKKLVLKVKEKKKIKEVKVYLEQHGYYDKTRKITPVDDGFGVPIMNMDIEQVKLELPEDLQAIFLPENILSVSLEASFSIKQKTSQYLSDWCQQASIQPNSIQFHHLEQVGDILLLDKHSFTGTMSEQLWKQLTDCPSRVNQEQPYQQSTVYALLAGLVSIYNSKRVAIQAEIDCGPKRQSHSKIIYSQYQKDDGWVTVRQNGVLYSWPFERVMFASGNNTERMRMGKIKATEEFVCDLYAGIGYFTIPIAVYAGIQHILCFEINEDSVEALKKNIQQNGVEEKCDVILGDNRVTTKEYHDIADRVLLGLLPSSREGWPLAIQLIKPSGGIFHLHENVHDNEFESFKVDVVNELTRLAELQGKPLSFHIQHIEDVKSYAPKVHHYVFDIVCKSNNF